MAPFQRDLVVKGMSIPKELTVLAHRRRVIQSTTVDSGAQARHPKPVSLIESI
jgi:hypothetical protein